MSQEVWLWLSDAQEKPVCRAHLRDLDLWDAASRGGWKSNFPIQGNDKVFIILYMLLGEKV